MPPKVLVIDDDLAVRTALKHLFEIQGYSVWTAGSGEDGLALCKQESPDLVLADIGLPGIDGVEVLRRIKQMDRSCRVVMITAYNTAGAAVEAMKLGAEDFITKPLPMEELRVLAARLVGQPPEERLERGQGLYRIVGESPAMQEVFEMVRRTSQTTSTVLITGESGTGKELVARAIHLNSERSDGPFLSVNCASIPGNLLEAELFGYEKGAFTDAKVQKRGLIEVAGNGTLFLDEMGTMALDLQAKILTVLETHRFRRLGGTEEVSAEVRFVAATNRDLEKAVESREFREDLYYRLNVLPIHLPPLRERKDDVLFLARHFLNEFSRHYEVPLRELAKEAEGLLQAYHWPGNVRELKNVIERAVLLTDRPVIEASDLSINRRSRDRAGSSATGTVTVSETGLIHVSFPPWGLSLEDLERQVIEEALKYTEGNISRAAKLLHVSRYTLRYRMQKHGIAFPER